MTDYAHLHALQVSKSKHDSSTGANGETISVRLHPFAEGTPISPLERDFYYDDVESGKTTHIGETAGTVIRSRWAKSFSFPAADVTLPFLMYYCTQGGAAATSNVIAATSVVEKHWWGPAALGTIYAFDAEDCTDPATTDSTLNFRVQNIVPTRVELTVGGLDARVSADLISGGEVAGLSGAPTTVTNSNTKYFLPNMQKLYTSDTAGYQVGTYNGDGVTDLFDFDPLSTAPSTRTELDGNLTDFTQYVESVTIRAMNGIDLDASYNASALDSDGAMVVADDGWIASPPPDGGQQVELDLTFKTGAADITGLRAEFEDGTIRPWEYWLINPSAIESGAYAGIRCTFAQMQPRGGFVEGTNGLGHKTVTLTYRALLDTTNGYGWLFSASNTTSASYGN